MDTEVVVVEDTSLWDSNAVILKTTAVITWKPNFQAKPLSCSLQSIEVFSCILGAEEETALSIIDPFSVSVEIVQRLNSPILLEPSDVWHVLEISAVNLNIRLSYYDFTMFMKIFDSIKRQTSFNVKTAPVPNIESNPNSANIECLMALGFSTEDCKKSLMACNNNINDAALWLTQNASPNTIADVPMICEATPSKSQKRQVNLNSAEIHISSFNLCIIDDCRDADVPVVELDLSDVLFIQKSLNFPEGSASFGFSVDYYNRSLSGWEPLMEPWICSIKWSITQNQSKPVKKFTCNVSSMDAINLNVTSTFMEVFQMVKKNWTEEYLTISDRSKGVLSSSPGCYRRRLPFMPFTLKNDTGCKLWFATQTISAKQHYINNDETSSQQNDKLSLSWTEVLPNNLVNVQFESRSKIRHKDSHSMKLHQIIVRVDGWLPTSAVSVDRVGTYFRQASPQRNYSASIYTEKPPARVVFIVELQGSAQKLITVQSALVVENRLDDSIELKLENSGMQYGVQSMNLYLVPHQSLPIPLCFVHAQILCRPIDRYVAFCNHSIAWHDVTRPGEVRGSIKQCNSIHKTNNFYRFLVAVKRRNFPAEKESPDGKPLLPFAVQPAHKIFFLPNLEIANLLPYDLHFLIGSDIADFIKPGKSKSIHSIIVSEQFCVQFLLENFKRCRELSMSSSARHYPSRVELFDNKERSLVLQLRSIHLSGGGLKLIVSAPFWVVNRTGLPLVFKQEGSNGEAAGQFEEHELARSMAPLLFSFADRDASNMCNMRVGRALHREGFPQWCTRFSLENGVRVRRLHITRKDSRPDWVYNIGIDVRAGRGIYGDTHIVTLSPRYQIDNRTSHKLEFCQLFATKDDNKQYILSAMPKSSLPYHWPRIDLDNLLCVRQPGITECNWSGGFAIDNIKSFHINMRDGGGKSNFLRVEIILQGATFFIVLTDADRLPPPFQIDNHSEVAVTYYQTNVEQERLKTSIRSHTSVPYAFDQPTLPPYITCCAPGGSCATYNMNIFREGSQLFYENFIYIIFTGTCVDCGSSAMQAHNLVGKEYVLDVPGGPYGNKIIINKREAGKRSQLWRMTSTGMLQHEGSSPPRDPHKPNSANLSKILVMDIADIAAQPGQFVNLILRKPDPRRHNTQTWRFTEEGRLCCAYPNIYVQSKDGFKGLRKGMEAVLGPNMPVSYVTMTNGIPMEQAISRKKLRGGSGVLTVKVIPDGPTRVLQITDLKRQQLTSRTSPSSEWVVLDDTSQNNKLLDSESSVSSDYKTQSAETSDYEFLIGIELARGLGISLINNLNEELVYVWLQNIMVEYNKTNTSLSLGGSIKDIQVDNQLRDAERAVMLAVTQQSKSDDQRHLPALHFTVLRIHTPVLNADIFKHLIVTMKNVTIQLEEKLLLKLLQFVEFDRSQNTEEKADENGSNYMHRNISESMAYEKRYYFSTLKLCLQQIKLSVLTHSNLPVDLLQLKRKARLRLIRFEDASIELNSYLRVHPFETAEFLINSIIEHYTEELKGQAHTILGSVDFLGNPLGLLNDVSDGMSQLIHEGNVGGLIKNVTHGLSDTAAKITETISDGLGMVSMDEKYQLKRKQIKQQSTVKNDHFMAGLKGFGFGIVGGVTSVFTQTYEGAVQEGVQGFFSGLGKGIIGTVTKPTVGFLDLAAGTASAMRDSSKESTNSMLNRARSPRICVGAGSLLPRYSYQQALGQEFLYNLNKRNFNELFIAKEQIRSDVEDLHALISNEQVYFLSSGSPSSNNIVLTVPFTDLYKCSCVCSDAGVVGETRFYLQLIMKAESAAGTVAVGGEGRRRSRGSPVEPLCKKPQVRCDSMEVAEKVAMQINYAKSLHEERTYTIDSDDDNEDEKE